MLHVCPSGTWLQRTQLSSQHEVSVNSDKNFASQNRMPILNNGRLQHTMIRVAAYGTRVKLSSFRTRCTPADNRESTA